MKNFIFSFIVFLLATGVVMAQTTQTAQTGENQFFAFENYKVKKAKKSDEIMPMADAVGFANDSALSLMNAKVLQNFSTNGVPISSNRTPIVVITTGFDGTHPELINRVRTDTYRDTISCCGIRDESGVGTAVLGPVAGFRYSATDNNNVSVIRAFDNNAGTLQSVLDSLTIAYDIIVRSGGKGIVFAHFFTTQAIPEFEAKIQEGLSRGIVIVTPAGDSGPNQIIYPAAYHGVISITAYDNNRNRTSFSGVGNVGAPGVGIQTTKKGGGSVSISGTSQATSLVVGILASYLEHRSFDVSLSGIFRLIERLKATSNQGVIDAGSLFDLKPLLKPSVALSIQQLGKAGENSSFVVSGSDPQNLPLTLTVTFSDGFQARTFDRNSTFSRVYNQAGNYSIKAIASNGKLESDPVTINFDIKAVDNRPPIINVSSEFSGVVGEAIRITGNVTDPDGDSVRVEVERSDIRGQFDVVSQNFDITRLFNSSGQFALTIQATDSKGLTTNQAIRFNIKERQPQNRIISAIAEYDSTLPRQLLVKVVLEKPGVKVSVEIPNVGIYDVKPRINSQNQALYRSRFKAFRNPGSVRVFIPGTDIQTTVSVRVVN